MNTRTEELIEALRNKYSRLKRENDCPDYVPKLAVYMDYEYWCECKSEFRGRLPYLSPEFLTEDTIMGFRVWRVPPSYLKSGEVKHPPFVIVNLDS